MEVHAPHQPVHTWKDFAIHLAVVTIGLFIALSLEGLVEYVHHRHLVREARENIRQEIEDNHKSALTDLASLSENIKLEQANIANIRQLRKDPKGFHGSITNTMNFNSMEDAAWRTARDTGALSYMPYAEVQRYSDLYMLVGLINEKAIRTGEADFHAAAPFELLDTGDLNDQDYTRVIRDNASVIVDLSTLKQFVTQLDAISQQELKR